MRILKFAIIGILLGFMAACCTVAISPLFSKFDGVDPQVQYLVNEYMYLAQQHNIKFENLVTIGFDNFKEGEIIGECYYGLYFREIYLDRSFWIESTATTRMAEVFHELSHCYCGRDHDYDDGKKYKPVSDDLVKNSEKTPDFKFDFTEDGFFPDACPLSLMYPRIVADYCMKDHYDYYVNEIFNRCNPY